MPAIEPGARNVLINVFTTTPDQQPAGLEALAALGQRVGDGAVPGLISSSVHRATDGTRIVNYVQWRSAEDMQRMLGSPEFQSVMTQAAALHQADFHWYEVAAVYAPPAPTPLSVYRRFKEYLLRGQFERLGEVVDVDGYTENCVGLTGWTTGLQTALNNFVQGISAAMTDMAAEEEDVIEGPDSLVIRSRVSAVHAGPFLGIPPTGRRVSWDAVDLYRVHDGRIVWRYLLSDWHAVVQQLTAEAAPAG